MQFVVALGMSSPEGLGTKLVEARRLQTDFMSVVR